MRNLVLLISIILLLPGCRRSAPVGYPKNISDTLSAPTETGQYKLYHQVYGRIHAVAWDTTTLVGQRKWLRDQLYLSQSSSDEFSDTLMDVNFDGYDDYLIPYYGSAGTGMKNRVAAYLFVPATHRYMEDTVISRMMNPSFYLGRKTITEFYLAMGSGYGARWQWINKKWVRTLEFEVPNDGDSSVWEIRDLNTGKVSHQHLPYSISSPPPDILESDYD